MVFAKWQDPLSLHISSSKGAEHHPQWHLALPSNLLPSGSSPCNVFSNSQVGQTESKTHQASTPGRSQSNIYYLHKTQLKLFSVTESKDVWKWLQHKSAGMGKWEWQWGDCYRQKVSDSQSMFQGLVTGQLFIEQKTCLAARTIWKCYVQLYSAQSNPDGIASQRNI